MFLPISGQRPEIRNLRLECSQTYKGQTKRDKHTVFSQAFAKSLLQPKVRTKISKEFSEQLEGITYSVSVVANASEKPQERKVFCDPFPDIYLD